ncbi:MAG: NUDIX hydrolase [Clostridia bacterium]|nr:NUDIX hydrolase [Clostridia bacterium]
MKNMDYGKQNNLNISTVTDDEKTIATAVNVIFVKRQEETGEIMIAAHKRKGTKAGAGQYGLPGGTQKAGETMEETAVREMQEELGVKLIDFKWDNFFQCLVSEKLHFVHHAFVCTTWEGEFKNAEPEKHDDIEWFCLKDLPLHNFFVSKGNVINFMNGRAYDPSTNYDYKTQKKTKDDEIVK